MLTWKIRRISKGSSGSSSANPIALLRDGDQPFVFDIRDKGNSYRLEFYDTASPENWTLVTPNVIILCYDISSRLSLINIQRLVRPTNLILPTKSDLLLQWIKETQRMFGARTDLPNLILGLKRDLRSETDANGIIYPQEAYRIAQEMRCDKYMECSATTGELVHEAFEDICKTAVSTTTAEGGLSQGGCCIMWNRDT